MSWPEMTQSEHDVTMAEKMVSLGLASFDTVAACRVLVINGIDYTFSTPEQIESAFDRIGRNVARDLIASKIGD
jgi:hypothetical protein